MIGQRGSSVYIIILGFKALIQIHEALSGFSKWWSQYCSGTELCGHHHSQLENIFIAFTLRNLYPLGAAPSARQLLALAASLAHLLGCAGSSWLCRLSLQQAQATL